VIVGESHRGRRIVGRLERGEDLVDGVAAACRERGVRSGELRAYGMVEEAELREFDPRARGFRPSRRFASPLRIVHCAGHVSEQDGALHVEATCALSRELDNGIELLGGLLVRARVWAVEFVIDAFDDLLLQRSIDAATGLPLFREARALGQPPVAPAPAPTPRPAAIPFEAPARGHIAGDPAPAAREPSWTEVAERSASAPPVEKLVEEPSDEPLRSGDVIEHPRFGRCEVERIEGDAEYAQVRLRNQRLVRLSLDVLQLVHAGNDGAGHRLFRVLLNR